MQNFTNCKVWHRRWGGIAEGREERRAPQWWQEVVNDSTKQSETAEILRSGSRTCQEWGWAQGRAWGCHWVRVRRGSRKAKTTKIDELTMGPHQIAARRHFQVFVAIFCRRRTAPKCLAQIRPLLRLSLLLLAKGLQLEKISYTHCASS